MNRLLALIFAKTMSVERTVANYFLLTLFFPVLPFSFSLVSVLNGVLTPADQLEATELKLPFCFKSTSVVANAAENGNNERPM